MFLSRAFHQDPPHRLGGGREKVPPAIPRLFGPGSTEQTQVSLVYEGRSLECLARLFAVQSLGRQFAQLVIDQRQELVCGARIARLDLRQDLRDVAHRRPPGNDNVMIVAAAEPVYSATVAGCKSGRTVGKVASNEGESETLV